MRRSVLLILIAVGAHALAGAGVGAAQDAKAVGSLEARPFPPDSLLTDPGWMSGQPPRWRLGIGPMFGYDGDLNGPTGRLFVDAEGRLAMPQFGLLDTNLEAALDVDRDGAGGALGAYAKIPYLRVGIERDLDDHRFDFVLSAQGSARRGGIFHHGERLRLDWLPGAKTVRAGFIFNTPWARYRQTRPFRGYEDLPKGEPPEPVPADASLVASEFLEHAEHALTWLDRLLTPDLMPKGFSSSDGEKAFAGALDPLLEHVRECGHDFAGEDSSYHANLELAFARASGGDAERGRVLARAAERVLFDEVVAPVDRSFGHRRHRDGLGGLAAAAQTRFARVVLESSPSLDPSGALAVQEVFRRVVMRIDAVAREARERWGTNSLVWLPVQFGLRPEQYDSQAEIESVVARIIGQPFSERNDIRYVLNDQFYYELQRTILRARYYHVLWIHDFRGVNGQKGPDKVAWSQAIEGYIAAMTEAVHALDRGERPDLPVFLLFLDEHYYEVNRSRRLISLLENLSSASAPKLDEPELETRLVEALARLHDAMSHSPELARRGSDYAKKRVRVQIHITYPLDPSYAGDILMRDHRKIAFYDVTEWDPAAGGAVYTGEGVGEHYAGSHWEDRSLVVRGPEAFRLREAARRLLLSQGFRASEIPGCLRPASPPEAASTAAVARAGPWTAHLLTAFNDTGWGDKPATVLKAVLYNILPRGSYLLVPDSIWTSDFWASMFATAALRGCRVYVIAPSGDHAPSNAQPTLGLMREAMAMLWTASERMAPEMTRAGGDLRVGLYTKDGDVSDQKVLAEGLLALETRPAAPFANVHFHPDVLRALRAECDTLEHGYAGPKHPFETYGDAKSAIHMKAQLFLSPEAAGVLSRREWGQVLANYLAIRRRQTVAPESEFDAFGPRVLCPSATCDSLAPDVFSAYRDSLRRASPAAAERAFCFATLGSHNQDRRSMLLDGEVLVAISGPAALTPAIDFACLMGSATWPKTRKELEDTYPEATSLMKRMRRWMSNLI